MYLSLFIDSLLFFLRLLRLHKISMNLTEMPLVAGSHIKFLIVIYLLFFYFIGYSFIFKVILVTMLVKRF